MVREQRGNNKFLSFYRHFLLRLFHEGLGARSRTQELDSLLGKVPYLNGGLFEIHDLERLNSKIEIPDSAFERVFDFFDRFQWYLDDRPLKADNEINPDILGYIFEKYVNQKEMGAYYTKDDITEYMTKNIIVPFLFRRLEENDLSKREVHESIKRTTRENPVRYIPQPMRNGIISDDGSEVVIPPDIAMGIYDPSHRQEWNNLVPSQFGSTAETWRGYMARRNHCTEVFTKLAQGSVESVADFVTYNLDVRQLAHDIVQGCESASLVLSINDILRTIRVLDPTCGSGAFLFQALNVLEPLYEGCIDRMEQFVHEQNDLRDEDDRRSIPVFEKLLNDIRRHPSRRYFILKSIILNNLFGVDIMEEAIEICKLRLFLKLASQVEPEFSSPNFGLEPLPDIDFNIRCGNALVGFTSYEHVKESITSGQVKLGNTEILDKIQSKAHFAEEAYTRFRDLQSNMGVDDHEIRSAKRELESKLQILGKELDRYLAIDYAINREKEEDFARWKETYKPFHWFLEFYGIIKTGGFDVVVGNPPYLEVREVSYVPRGFACEETRAIHAMCIERSLNLLRQSGSISMIVPMSLVSTQRMKLVQNLIEKGRTVWYSNYSWRPGRLFDTVNRALTIFVATSIIPHHTYSTNYQRWNSKERDFLFQTIRYVEIPRDRSFYWAPKLGNKIEESVLKKMLSLKTTVKDVRSSTKYRVFYRTDGGLYWKVFTDFPPAFKIDGKPGHSSREVTLGLVQAHYVKPVIGILSSDIFWWWYTVTSNLRHLNPTDIESFPLPSDALKDPELSLLAEAYLKDIKIHSSTLIRVQRQTGKTETQSFKIQKSKTIINRIDRLLAKYYGLTEEELDLLENYDISFRMTDSEDGEEQLAS